MNPYRHRYPSIYRGRVESTNDPLHLGRCRVRVPSINGNIKNIKVLPWARPVTSSPVGSGRGSMILPKVGDIVWVLFEGEDKDSPVYLGGTPAIDDIPIDPTKAIIYIDEGNGIIYDTDEQYYTINVGDNSITVSKEGITIKGNVTIEGNLSVSGTIDPSCSCGE